MFKIIIRIEINTGSLYPYAKDEELH